MLVSYFIPEDGDSQNHPNIFQIKASGTITLGQLKKSFPVPGVYYFRFLKNINGMSVWLDVNDENAQIPLYDGKIMAKVTRIHAPHVEPVHAPVAHTEPVIHKTESKDKVPATRERRNSEKLISFDDDAVSYAHHAPVPAAAAAPAFSDDLLGFGSSSPPQPARKAAPAASMDFLGFDNIPPPAATTSLGNNMQKSSSGASIGMMGQQQPAMGGGRGRGMMNNSGFDAFSGLNGGLNPMQSYNSRK